MTHPTETRETRAAAKELRFLVPPARAAAMLEWARQRMTADPHGAGEHGDGYRTTSLYFDTAAFDVYQRRRSFRRSKYRVRRYDSSDVVFLERKLRTSALLSKRRTTVDPETLALLDATAAAPGWAGEWFRKRIAMRRLRPVCQVSYDRVARIATSGGRTIRLTFDTHLVAQSAHALRFLPERGLPVLSTHTIVEMKFGREVPAIFKQLMEEFRLSGAIVSKYRASMDALGVRSAECGVHRSSPPCPTHRSGRSS